MRRQRLTRGAKGDFRTGFYLRGIVDVSVFVYVWEYECERARLGRVLGVTH